MCVHALLAEHVDWLVAFEPHFFGLFGLAFNIYAT